ncbi:MAG: carbohydrate kinase family protein [Deltaproteobacteria bacterium]|nr:carbohydrate kinase family protein [Deltaproteobacteria bacterium]
MNNTIFCAGTIVVDIITGEVRGAVKPDSGHNTGISSNAGGNALNVALDLSGLEIAGDNIICCGAIGNDPEGDFLKSTFKKSKINDQSITVDDAGTGKAIIVTFDNGRRGFIVDKGASIHFKSDDLLSKLNKIKPGIFYIGESPASPDIDGNLKYILKQAKEMNCINIVDYIILSDSHSGSLFECAPYTDILHINEYEAKVVTGQTDIAKGAQFLREKGFPVVFVSEGEKGFVFSYGDTLKRFPVFNVNCIDATGAGDAFCLGIIYYVLNGGGIPDDLTDLALFASACGACAVTETGCTKGLTLKKAENLLKTQGPEIRDNIC